ncbi:MAG: hypothetical protein ACRDI1_04045, partial [Actinomycetota bacterium]
HVSPYADSGGAGVDMALYHEARSPLEIDLAAGFARESLPGPRPPEDSLSSIESAVGGHFEDIISGDEGPNILIGGPGGQSGDDVLNGRGGSDILFPSQDGEANGGDGEADLLDFSLYHLGPVDADLASGTAVTHCSNPNDLCESGSVTLEGIEWLRGADWFLGPEKHRDVVVGASDHLTGDDAPNVIFGLDGDDEISGGAGDDYLSGGEGNDSLDGQDGDDECIGGQVSLNCESDIRPPVHPLEAYRLSWTKLRFE